MKKTWIFSLLFILCASLLSAQSLYELAQKEKRRRAQNKGKTVKVVTNADLRGRDRAPAVSVRSPQSPTRQTDVSQRPDSASVPPDSKGSSPRVTLARSPAVRQDTQEALGAGALYASRVLSETQNVTNPELALGRPDGQFAQVNIYGFLDLELPLTNGPGDDVVVYARRQDEGLPNMLQNYIVYVRTERGEWEALGSGAGLSGSERFDLGEIRNASAVRIVFSDPRRPSQAGEYRIEGTESRMGIDAVESMR
jgi:hypothetical protein